jgi:ATP-binding cassette subfamily B protein/subfamily B ATP-binding cassette protein MsbA
MLFSFASPLLVKSLIDDVFIGGKTELFNIILLATAATYVISAVSAYLSSYSKGKLELVLFNDVVKEAFDAVQSASMRKTEEMKVGDLISRIVVNTRSAIAIFTQIIPLVFFNAACMIIPFIIMLLYSWQLTLIVTIPALLFVLPMSFFGKRLEQTQKVSLMRTGLIYSLLKECLSIVPLIKVFRLEEWSRCKLDEQMKGYYDASIDYTKNSSLNSSVDSMIYGVPMILLFVFGGPMLMQGSLTIGTFTLFLSNIALVFGPISQFAYLWSYYKSSSPSFERVEEILHLERDIGGYEGLIIKNGKVDFNNISFSYNDRYILQGFNATFNRGLNYVIGENGTGKSTILKLLCALYPLEKGSIEIDGQDIAMVKNADLRKNISMIFSEPYLFDGSIYENILIGNLLASEEEVKSAAKLVRIHEFITNLPQGYKTQVGESGLKLSSGEKQKIALARAILKDSPIILLDEVTKSIDADSRRSINEVIKSLKNEKTIIIVTHDTNEIEYDSNKIYLGQKNNLNDAAFSYASCQISNEASFAGQKRTTEKAIATRISTLLLGHLPRIEL